MLREEPALIVTILKNKNKLLLKKLDLFLHLFITFLLVKLLTKYKN